MSKHQIPRLFMVQRLYRRVLKLHRTLPGELKDLGDKYAKDEFRRNKSANQLQAFEFMNEWKKQHKSNNVSLSQRLDVLAYCKTLETQFYSNDLTYGKDLDKQTVDSLSQEQLGQIYELQQETTGKKDNEK